MSLSSESKRISFSDYLALWLWLLRENFYYDCLEDILDDITCFDFLLNAFSSIYFYESIEWGRKDFTKVYIDLGMSDIDSMKN
jgi:hypothetical protein